MQVIFLGHACHLVEVDGVRVLTDPWLTDPIFEGLVEHDPTLAFGVGALPALDVIAITHAHLDHFNAPTLAAIADKSIPVVHPPAAFTEIERNLRLLGFSNLHARADYAPFKIGSVRIVPTPSRGMLDECAYLIEGRSGRVWDGADAPQPADLIEQIASRFGPVDLAAVSHNSFDQPSLLGLASMKPTEHGPEEGARSAAILGAGAAMAGASNMRWCGTQGAAVTRKVIRCSHADLRSRIARDAPQVKFVELAAGDAWSPEAGVERAIIRGSTPRRVTHDYIHAYLDSGERWCPGTRPSTEDTFRRDFPARLAAAPTAAQLVNQRVVIEVTGDDPGTYTVDFREPGSKLIKGDDGAPYGFRLPEQDWKDLFERKVNWQVVAMCDRLRVTRFRAGAPPAGLNFVYALQAVFP